MFFSDRNGFGRRNRTSAGGVFCTSKCPRGHFSAMLAALSNKGVAKGSLRRTEAPLETFTEPKELTENPQFAGQRQESLAAFSNAEIDAPIIEIIENFNKLPFCFTLQSCYGHFLYDGQGNPLNLEPLPVSKTMARVEYRIAYVALCPDQGTADRLATFLSPKNRWLRR